jgi:hypothetical protein
MLGRMSNHFLVLRDGVARLLRMRKWGEGFVTR